MNIVLVGLASHNSLGGFDARDAFALLLLAAGLVVLGIAAYRVCKEPCGHTALW
ncbi:MAG: hypothetical protein WC969_08510 [Elusimicrobiota bacterium]